MDIEMQNYLENMAIEMKVENYKEFGKTKEQTICALMNKFHMSQDKAQQKVELLWE